MERNSSVELFRILATFLVLFVHFNGWFLGMPGEFQSFSVPNIGQALIEGFSVVCVNCFLVISGYFGIRLKLKSIWNIYVLLVSIYVPFYIISAIYTDSFTVKACISNFFALSRESYYVQDYLMLCFLSPILNSFIDTFKTNFKRKNLLYYVLVFWFIEIYFEFIRDNDSLGFQNGYSLIHFVLIYMLARTLSLFKDAKILRMQNIWFAIYFMTSLLTAVMFILKIPRAFTYSNPLVVLGAFSLFIPFTNMHFYNKNVNWIAKSTFAVFLMHTCPPLIQVLIKIDNYFYKTCDYGIFLILISSIIIATFMICIVYDKLRILVTSRISDFCFEKLFNKIHLSNQ